MKKEAVVIVFLVIAIILLLSIVQFYKQNLEHADAKKFVTEDLKGKYPNADIEVISIEDKINKDGAKYSFIKVKVTNDPQNSCPERLHTYYNYPEQNFVTQPTEYVTKNCEIMCKVDSCVIAFPEEAIIASHTLPGTGEIKTYLGSYPDTVANAVEESKGWKVTFDSNLANYYYEVLVSKTGKILGINKNGR